MRKSWLFTLGVAASLSLGSCSSLTKTAQYEDVNVQIHSATIADLDVRKEKVTKTAEWKYNILKPFSVEEGKKNAMADLLKEVNADVLVEPEFTVSRRGFMRGGSVTVTGYPATFTGFHPLTAAEAAVINPKKQKVITQPVASSARPVPFSGKKKSRITDPKQRIQMINIIGGWIPRTDDMAGGQWGLMYGSYKNHWGWYVKAVVPYAHMVGDHYATASHTGAGFSLTGGAIWRPANDWSIHFGTGFTTTFEGSSGLSKGTEIHTEAALPLDLGVNWNCYGPLNIMFGLQGVAPYDSGYASINPYIGVGINF